MKGKILKIISIVLCSIMLIAVLAGCGGGDTTTTTTAVTTTTTATTSVTTTATEVTTETVPETITVTDGYGREVTLEKPVKTVASGIYRVTEQLMALGLKDRIVGIDRTTSTSTFLFRELLSLPLVQNADDHYVIDYEKMIEVNPDVFITGVVPLDGFDDIVDTLAPEIPVIAISYDIPEQVVDSINLLGELFDCREAADEYLTFFQGTMDTITSRVADIPEEDKVKVYYEMMPYFTFSKSVSSFHNHIAIPGGVNVAADMASAYGKIDPEWVIEQNPDVIVFMAMPCSMMGSTPVSCGYEVDDDSEMEALRDSIMNRSELSEVTAVKEGRVYVIHYELPNTSCIGFAQMAKWFYPDLFEDLDPRALHQEYLTRFMGIDYDLSEHGVFVYPES